MSLDPYKDMHGVVWNIRKHACTLYVVCVVALFFRVVEMQTLQIVVNPFAGQTKQGACKLGCCFFFLLQCYVLHAVLDSQPYHYSLTWPHP